MNHPCKMTEDVGVTGYKAPEVAACDKEGNGLRSTDGPGILRTGLVLLGRFLP